ILGGVAAADDGTISGTVEAKPSKFLKDTVVFIKEVPAKPSPITIEIDQKNLTFDPHIALAAIGDTVKFHNHDKVDHNVTSPEGKYALGTWGVGATKDHVYTAPGVYSQVCKLHPEMLAYVFVGQNRFAAVVADNGKFMIANVPAGNYELEIWNPKLKAAPQKVTVTAKAATTVHFSLAR